MTPRRDPASARSSKVATPSSPTHPSSIEQALLGAVALGLLAMLSFPAARVAGETVGWLPFWLVALPVSAWLTARTLRLREAARRVRRPLASVHAIAGARIPRTRTTPPLRRAA